MASELEIPEDLKAIHYACKFEHLDLAGYLAVRHIERIARAEAENTEARRLLAKVYKHLPPYYVIHGEILAFLNPEEKSCQR